MNLFLLSEAGFLGILTINDGNVAIVLTETIGYYFYFQLKKTYSFCKIQKFYHKKLELNMKFKKRFQTDENKICL